MLSLESVPPTAKAQGASAGLEPVKSKASFPAATKTIQAHQQSRPKWGRQIILHTRKTCVDSGSDSIIHSLRFTTSQGHINNHTIGTISTTRVIDRDLETRNDGRPIPVPIGIENFDSINHGLFSDTISCASYDSCHVSASDLLAWVLSPSNNEECLPCPLSSYPTPVKEATC